MPPQTHDDPDPRTAFVGIDDALAQLGARLARVWATLSENADALSRNRPPLAPPADPPADA